MNFLFSEMSKDAADFMSMLIVVVVCVVSFIKGFLGNGDDKE